MTWFTIALALAAIAVMIAVSITDLRERRIPNKIMYPSLLVALVTAPFTPIGWQSALMGAGLGAIVFLIPVLSFGKRGGMGDVKLATFIGLLLGFSATFYAIVIAVVAAALVAIVGVLAGKWNRRTLIPFGPFLALGGISGLVVLYLAPNLTQFF